MEAAALNLKHTLTLFINENSIPEGKLDMVIRTMLSNIGSTDSELRDELIYIAFGKLITQNMLTSLQEQHILAACLDEEHLFYKIGETETDSVFTRSFSALVIALQLNKDRVAGTLPEELVEQALSSSILYLQKEVDTRGFVDGKGWAHSIAHGADLLTAAIKHPSFSMDLADSCLAAIQCCLYKEAIYIDDEDERLVFAVEALLEKGMSESVLKKLAHQLSGRLDELHKGDGFSIGYFNKRRNVVSFLRSLYFRLAYGDTASNLRRCLIEIMKDKHLQVYR